MKGNKLVSWQTYLKSKPTRYCRHDSTFGTKSVIEPTLLGNGFLIQTHEYDNWDKNNKPKKLALEILGGVDFSEAVYYTYPARDYHTHFIVVAHKQFNRR